jgi:hypothetical protein
MATTQVTCAAGPPKDCKQVSYSIGNDRCLTKVSLTGMTVTWTDNSGNKPRWETAKFNGSAIASNAAGIWTETYAGNPEVGTATKSNFSSPAPTVPYATPMNGTNTTVVTYVFDKDTKQGSKKNTFSTNQFVFILLDALDQPSSLTTTCNLPSLTVE